MFVVKRLVWMLLVATTAGACSSTVEEVVDPIETPTTEASTTSTAPSTTIAPASSTTTTSASVFPSLTTTERSNEVVGVERRFDGASHPRADLAIPIVEAYRSLRQTAAFDPTTQLDALEPLTTPDHFTEVTDEARFEAVLGITRTGEFRVGGGPDAILDRNRDIVVAWCEQADLFVDGVPADLDAGVFLPPAGSYIREYTLIRQDGELLIAGVETVLLERCQI